MPDPTFMIVLVVVASFAVVVPITLWVLKKDRTDRSNDNVSTAGIRFIGGVFVLIGSFSIVTLWGAQSQASERMTRELTTLALFTDNVSVAAPADEPAAYALLQQYVTGVRNDELSVLASGQRLDPSVALSDQTTQALDGFNVLLNRLQEQGTDDEQVALSLGANGWQTFWHVTLPNVKWALLYGVLLCNARAMGEFGAVSVVSGHIRGQTNTVPLHIEILYNEYQFTAAFAFAALLALLALVTLAAKTVVETLSRGQFRADAQLVIASKEQ